MRYRKLPIIIEAFQYDGDLKSSDGNYCVPRWVIKAFENGIMFYGSTCDGDGMSPCNLFIKTLEGKMLVGVGDYIIKGIDEELYPCKPDIFEKTYEIVE